MAEEGLVYLNPWIARDLAWAYEVAGEARWFCGDLDGAQEAYRQARTLFAELNIQEGIMLTEHHFGQIGVNAASLWQPWHIITPAWRWRCNRMTWHGRPLPRRAGRGGMCRGRLQQAATLLAAAWQRFDSVPPFLPPCDEAEYEVVRHAVEASLPAAAWTTAWAAGGTLAPASLIGAAESRIG